MANTTITIDDDILNDTLSGTLSGTVSIGAVGAGGSGVSYTSTYPWNGTSSSVWTNSNYTVTGSTTIGNIGAGVGYNGTFSITQPTIKIDVEDGEKCVISTPKNKVDIDELAEMVKLLKSLLVAVASDEEFASRNPALAEAAHDMLINKLKG